MLLKIEIIEKSENIIQMHNYTICIIQKGKLVFAVFC